MQTLKISESKVSVVYGAASSHLSVPTGIENKVRGKLKQRYGINRKFILTVSVSHPHKNFYRLIEAYHILYKKYQIDCQLVIVGVKGRAQSALVSVVEKLSLEKRVIFTGWIPDEHLSLFYCEADLFIIPSLFEGFGIPILEAMAHGTAVVSSDSASLPEIAGDAALLVDPYNIDEISEAIYKVLIDQNLRKNLIEKGLKRVKQFSWEKAARETLNVYQEVYRR